MFTFTDRAIAEIEKAAHENPILGLRVSVQPAGCAGFNYGMAFETLRQSSDVMMVIGEGIKVFVDPASFALLEGATVDFTDDGHGGFVFHNPNAKAKVKCTCGH